MTLPRFTAYIGYNDERPGTPRLNITRFNALFQPAHRRVFFIHALFHLRKLIMSFSDINTALVEAYQAAALNLPTAYEGRDFTPTAGQAWASLSLVPQPVVSGSLGASGNDRHSGNFQIDLNDVPGGGIDGLLAKADALRAYFFAGRQLSHNGQAVVVSTTSRSIAIVKDGWLRLSVIVAWTAWTSHA